MKTKIKIIYSNYYLDEITSKLLSIRDIKKEEINSFLNPSIKNFLLVPKPYDFGVFGNIAHALIKGIDENSTTVSGKYLAQSLSLLMPVNFIGPIPIVNTAMEPIIELMMNQDAFTGNSVRKYYDSVKINDLRIKGAKPRMHALRKSEQESGVNTLAAICAICKSQFSKVLPNYDFDPYMVVSVHQLVSDAIVLQHKLKQKD